MLHFGPPWRGVAAIVAAPTTSAPPSRSARTASSRVAPVVTTSSITTTRRPAAPRATSDSGDVPTTIGSAEAPLIRGGADREQQPARSAVPLVARRARRHGSRGAGTPPETWGSARRPAARCALRHRDPGADHRKPSLRRLHRRPQRGRQVAGERRPAVLLERSDDAGGHAFEGQSAPDVGRGSGARRGRSSARHAFAERDVGLTAAGALHGQHEGERLGERGAHRRAEPSDAVHPATVAAPRQPPLRRGRPLVHRAREHPLLGRIRPDGALLRRALLRGEHEDAARGALPIRAALDVQRRVLGAQADRRDRGGPGDRCRRRAARRSPSPARPRAAR